MRARVIKSTGSWYEILDEQSGTILKARTRGRLKLSGHKLTNPIAVGDWVQYEKAGDETAICSIEKRQNYLIRKSVNLSKQQHIIASNIDILGFVFCLKNPETTLSFLDRALVTAEAYSIPVIILFNKTDLLNDEDRSRLNNLKALYTAIGYRCMEVSAADGTGIEALKHELKDKTTVFFGHSGAGKSTLVNAIQPGLEIKTGEISEVHLQGKHTTTFAQMHFWSFGGSVIDTPGVREFGLTEVSPEELGHYFPEIFEKSSECGFHNCLHLKEPKCAVKKAVEDGEIAESRYQNYLQMLEDME